MPAKLRVSLVVVVFVAVSILSIRSLKSAAAPIDPVEIGREIAVPQHLQDREEYEISLRDLLAHGERLFSATWTVQEGAGRPLTKGTGASLTDMDSPLVFPRNFNRISAPDSNSCAGCHNAPFGVPGGGGDFVTSVFVLGQRFDFSSFDLADGIPTRGGVDEEGNPVTQGTIANRRATLGMFGSGYIEMLARQMTADLQSIRDATNPGTANLLISKGISFGIIGRNEDGSWDTSGVEGLAPASLASSGEDDPPSLVIRPFHQTGTVVSLRQFTNNAMNHHHGIQSTERFGLDTDPDGDGFENELTRADMTAISLYQATLPVPGQVIPNNPEIEAAVMIGEARFSEIGCASCHVPSLPLDDEGWIYSEPNPYNPEGNLQTWQAPGLEVDLSGHELPEPRLRSEGGVVYVPAFTDLKLHNICSGPDDPNAESLDQNQPAGSTEFFAGNCLFITRKLWGTANEPPYFHHGQFTTLREAILAHDGEALASRQAFDALTLYEQDSIVEFLKTLQVLPPGTKHRIVDENGHNKTWPSR